MPSYYWYECKDCGYRAERYRNIKRCPKCGGLLLRTKVEFACYHVTTKDRLANILKEGLVPNSKPNWFTTETPYIMLSLYPYWWLYKDAVLIEVKDPAIKREYFEDPEGLRWGQVIKPENFNAVVAYVLNADFESRQYRAMT